MSEPSDSAAASPSLVSVIIPVYKRVEYLSQAIESALGQTHPRVEVIVVDDGSPVDPGPVTERFGSRVRLIRKSNGGLSSARNAGMAQAAGEYVSFLDDDDYLEPDALETLLAGLQATPGAVWAAGTYAYVEADGRLRAVKPRRRYESGDVYPPMIFNNLMGAPSVVLVRADSMRAVGGFDETFWLSEDWDAWLSLARDHPIAAVQKKVSNYRVHGQQVTRTQWVRCFEYNVRVLEKHRERARPELRHLFALGLAGLHRRHGDKLYVAGERVAARKHWRQAAELGGLGRCALAWRLGKSLIPTGFAQAVRTWRKTLDKSFVR
jgi:glycosyltransferase involved in cell wall biosynthesis